MIPEVLPMRAIVVELNVLKLNMRSDMGARPTVGMRYYLWNNRKISYLCLFSVDAVSFLSCPEEGLYQVLTADSYGDAIGIPETYSLWVNVYAEGEYNTFHKSRWSADTGADDDRIKCIELKYEV